MSPNSIIVFFERVCEYTESYKFNAIAIKCLAKYLYLDAISLLHSQHFFFRSKSFFNKALFDRMIFEHINRSSKQTYTRQTNEAKKRVFHFIYTYAICIFRFAFYLSLIRSVFLFFSFGRNFEWNDFSSEFFFLSLSLFILIESTCPYFKVHEFR